MVPNQATTDNRRTIPRRFTPNGCSGVPDFIFSECCDEHDYYFQLGPDVTGVGLLEAGKRLYACMKEKERRKGWKYTTLFPLMYALGGTLLGLPTYIKYRWEERRY